MPDPRDVSVNDLLYRIVCALVDDTGAVEVKTKAEEESVTFAVSTHPLDVGKQGRTARSIRTILVAAGMKDQRRYLLDIQEQPKDLAS
jgi:predicted RNA-binding protein YlqC (UPF0109 family)